MEFLWVTKFDFVEIGIVRQCFSHSSFPQGFHPVVLPLERTYNIIILQYLGSYDRKTISLTVG